jgi:hypothetical protein
MSLSLTLSLRWLCWCRFSMPCSMVGSTINSTASAHLMPLASHGDLDGPLLVKTASGYRGGLGFSTDAAGAPTGDLVYPVLPGLGLEPEAAT